MVSSCIGFKLRGFSIVDQWNLQMSDSTTPDDIFTQFLSTLQTFFGNLIHSFTDILPTYETISHLLNIAAEHYLLAAVVLIVCIYFIICFSSCISSIGGLLYKCMSSIVKFLYRVLSWTIKFIYSCLTKCLGVGRPAVKMMVAPGRAPLRIARAVFEASPKAYFAALRMVSV